MGNSIKIVGLVLLTFQIVSAQGLSKACMDEILALTAKNPNFDVKSFLTDLPIEVVKTKAKLKLPFGKPKDNEVTSVGITVGCIKTFPESPAQIATVAKDIGIELAKKTAKGAVASAGGAALGSALAPGAAGAGVPGVGTAVGAAGAGAGVAGFLSGRAASASPVVMGPVLKKCEFIFNPQKKFCYDGAVYDKCDGMEYNPTTHICTGDVANIALCNNIQYNPTIQRCEGNAIQLKCGNDWYNSSTHSCYNNNKVVIKCGINPQAYNPDLMECKPKINANGIFLKTPVQHGDEHYEAVLIGEQIWLARNLNSTDSNGTCYNEDVNNCTHYGKLYDLEAARTACPTGWFLPSDDEWKMLIGYAGGTADVGGKLKATTFGGTDEYGFSALPSGFGISDIYSGVGDLNYWWSSTESSAYGAYGYQVKRDNSILSRESLGKSNLFSIRCLQYANPEQRKTRFFANITSEPSGVDLKFNGTVANNCSITPCKIELREGKYNINFAKDYYDSANTTIALTGDKFIHIKLVPNFGILNVREPSYVSNDYYYDDDDRWDFAVNGKSLPFGEIRLSPDTKYTIKLTHRCYEDIVDTVFIKKGGRVDYDMTKVAKNITLKQSKVVLNTAYKWRYVEEPIFVNNKEIGKTPWNGSVPLCSEIAIMEPENKIKMDLSEDRITKATYKKSIFTSTFIGTALNLAGVIFLGVGLSANADADVYYRDYSNLSLYARQERFDDLWDKHEEKKKDRNFYYLMGSVLLVSGIGVHIWF